MCVALGHFDRNKQLRARTSKPSKVWGLGRKLYFLRILPLLLLFCCLRLLLPDTLETEPSKMPKTGSPQSLLRLQKEARRWDFSSKYWHGHLAGNLEVTL